MRFDYFDPKLDKWIKYFRSLTPEQRYPCVTPAPAKIEQPKEVRNEH